MMTNNKKTSDSLVFFDWLSWTCLGKILYMERKENNAETKLAVKKDRLEFSRFFFVGCLTTAVDIFVMGIILYLFEPDLYPKFYNVWFGGIGSPKTIATVLGTGIGFAVGIALSYILSIFYVYKDKGNSRTLKGAILFFALSIGGMFLNMLGMWLGYDVLGINEWLTKIVMMLLVLFYNYFSRKLLIFKKEDKHENAQSETE